MKGKLVVDGIAVISLVTGGLVPTAAAVHAHHHGDVIGRIMHKSKAISGSRFNTTDLDVSNGPTLPEPTTPVEAVICLDNECDSVAAHFDPLHSARIGSVPHQLQTRTFQMQQLDLAATPTRRRPYPRPSQVVIREEKSPESKNIVDPIQQAPADRLLNDRDDGFTAELGSSLGLRSLDLDPHVLEARQDNSYQDYQLGPFPRPTSTSVAPAATATSVCPSGNGTTYTSADGIAYQIVCDIDFLGYDFPFEKVSEFGGCVQKCDAYNWDNHGVLCLAALYVPNRRDNPDNCYLKNSVAEPAFSTLRIEGAIRLTNVEIPSSSSIAEPSATNAASSLAVSSNSLTSASSSSTERPSSIPTSSTTTLLTSATDSSTSTLSALSTKMSTSTSAAASTSTPPVGSEPGVTYASGYSVIIPKVAGSRLHGPSRNTPSKQYVNDDGPKAIELAKSLLVPGVNGDLTTGYDVSPQTGILNVNIATQSYLGSLSGTPHLSRDGGSGGMVNGQHLFVFCDTGTYTTATENSNGKFTGFVSSSVAIDTGMNGLSGKPIDLLDGIGQWSDDAGRMRGFAPLTEGEQAYNLVMQGGGQRYAIWPESSIIPIDGTSGIMYAPIVYDNVNRQSKTAVFTYSGATLLTITAGGRGGPVAERTVKRIFDQDEIEWGCVGGIRSWGPSGIGGDDGAVYIFGNIRGGILLGRTSPAKVADRNSFDFWDGNSWTKQVPNYSSAAFFIEGAFMDLHLFYSPRHLTFIIVYLTIYADSTFYYRYLETDQAILPPYAPGGDPNADYVENILKYSWSEEKVLYKAAQGLSGTYIYAGAVHAGYFGSNDVINGGSKMLLSWTAPTGQDPSSVNSEYQIITADIDWE